MHGQKNIKSLDIVYMNDTATFAYSAYSYSRDVFSYTVL